MLNQKTSQKKQVPKQSFVLRTESILLPKGETKHLTSKCNISRIVYNSANHHFRPIYQETGKGPNRSSVWNWLKNHHDFPLWKDAIGTKTCQQIVNLLVHNYSSYFKALKAWKVDSSKFLSKPKSPGFINKTICAKRLFILPIAAQSLRVNHELGILKLPKRFDLTVRFNQSKGKEVRNGRIIPIADNRFVFQISYRDKAVPISVKNSRIASIDLGVNNLVTLSTNFGSQPFKINGGPVKSINQYFNKEKARLDRIYAITNAKGSSKRDKLIEKRNRKLSDFFHKSSRSIINYCISQKIDTIVIGLNDFWKQNVKMRKKDKQNFVYLPFRKLIDQIMYKAADSGIQVIVNEENYTSKCSFLDNEFPQKYSSYLGKRVKRGKFRANDGTY
ncbi:MAG: hypothetical protein HeimC2_46200 [Candidatus Heimdallarchaeota archaeon LC_2]|nr:MAG: hypothetical protein HeimC2_46200 [Candidatus Heimdallarchaeota archaeon LC_2]